MTGYSDSSQVNVNRTVPKVDPPRSALEFSATPTEDEFFRARVFAEPLVPIGGKPTASENSALAAALLGYAKRSGPDDFSALTDFLKEHPQSPWAAALLTDMGIEYYNTAHYSLALDAWSKAWELGQNATEPNAQAIAGRAAGELAGLLARLGRVTELEALFKSVEGRVFTGPAADRMDRARGGLRNMKERPGISFRCGPLALERIKLSLEPNGSAQAIDIIRKSTSTDRGFSLTQVAELSTNVGLNLQMAHRDPGAPFLIPSVVHWKVGHYAALLRKVGDRYLLQDPTFRNDVWATKKALEDETSGYFLVPAGKLGAGWKPVEAGIGDTIWGKGGVEGPDPYGGGSSPAPSCKGMPVPSMDLLFVSLTLNDDPVGYTPPVGPAVRFPVHYNQRDSFQPAIFSYSNLGPQWTFDWLCYITDNPSSPMSDVQYYRPGGFARSFTGFDSASQSYAYQQYDQTLLVRTTASSYEMTLPDGSKLVFGQSDGSVGTSRNIFLTQKVDPQGNAVTLTYDVNLRVVAITDAIGQVTTLTYGLTNDIYKVTKITDPFGRFATFNYVTVDIGWTYTNFNVCPAPYVVATPIQDIWLSSITDVIGLSSQFSYFVISNFSSSCAQCPTNGVVNCVTNNISVPRVVSMNTPYGTTTFSTSATGSTTPFIEIAYPDGSQERAEFNQTPATGTPYSDPPASIPAGMRTQDDNLNYRNTYYWSRTACATGYGDYSKARIYHWLHTDDIVSAAGILESTKEALEGRVWRDYAGQGSPELVGNTSLPAHVGRVLDDGSTQLYSYTYNGFGHPTTTIDPAGRTLSYIYDTNGIDLLEIRQTRAGNNELLAKATYNAQHRPPTVTDAAGQTTTYTYNTRGQILAMIDPKNESTAFTYDTNGYLLAITGPLPGTNMFTYDAYGRVRNLTDVSGYMVTLDYDNLDRVTRITHPDGTASQFTYNRLDRAAAQDRAGRQTSFEHDNMRQLTSMIDPLGRQTLFDWCRCGALKSLTDPMGRTTSWVTDVQGRRTSKQFADGSQVQYLYENTTSRLQQIIDEKQQSTFITRNTDNTIQSVSYGNYAVTTPNISFTYDPNYNRVISMTDGVGTTIFNYQPVVAPPVLGAGRLASVTGPLTNDTCTYAYDELGRLLQSTIDGVVSSMNFDAKGRITAASNELGVFTYAYDGSSYRLVSKNNPNGQTAAIGYGNNLQDFLLTQITYAVGANPVSQFSYGRDIARMQITTWSQQAGAQSPSIFSFGYDAADQLLTAAETNSGVAVGNFAYTYDPAGNRLTELAGGVTTTSAYNALNQLSTKVNATVNLRTNEWDAQNRLTAVNAGSNRTEFGYDGLNRLAYIRQLQNGSEVSFRRFVWCGGRICEERDKTGATITKRFDIQGVMLLTGTNAGNYYYTRDHLGSIREMTDAAGNVRARYSYDPFGRKTKVSGDVDADFGFAGMFWSSEASLALTRFRPYDPELGRWLSRDPLAAAELREGPNLYAYVRNQPVNHFDPEGLCEDTVCATCQQQPCTCAAAGLLPTAQAAAQVATATGAIVTAAGGPGAVVQDLNVVGQNCAQAFQTLPGIGPDTINVFSQTSPILNVITPNLDQVEVVVTQLNLESASAQWFVQTMAANDPYLQWLWENDYWAYLDYVNKTEAFSRALFGL